MLYLQVNAFFLKFILWVPPLNPLNTYRLLLLFALALPAVREWYVFIESDSRDVFNKLGPFAWLGSAVVLTEVLIIVKFGRRMFPEPWPPRVLYVWVAFLAISAVAMTIWSIQHYVLGHRRQKKVQ